MKNRKKFENILHIFHQFANDWLSARNGEGWQVSHLSHSSHYKNDDFYLVKRRFIMANSSFYKSGSM